MDKAKMKKILKPLVQECLREMILDEEGVLSHIISEVVKAQGGMLVERQQPQQQPVQKQQRLFESDDEARNRMEKMRNRLNEVAGGSMFNGVEPIPGESMPMGNIPPALMAADAGVNVEDLAKLVGGAGRWKASVDGKKR